MRCSNQLSRNSGQLLDNEIVQMILKVLCPGPEFQVYRGGYGEMFNPSLPDGNLSTIFPGHTDRCDVDIGWGGGGGGRFKQD